MVKVIDSLLNLGRAENKNNDDNFGDRVKAKENKIKEELLMLKSKAQTADEIEQAKRAHALWFGDKERGIEGFVSKAKRTDLRGLSNWTQLLVENILTLLDLAKAQDADALTPFPFIPRPALFDEVIEAAPGIIKAKIIEFMSTDKDYPSIRHKIFIDDKGHLWTEVTQDGKPLDDTRPSPDKKSLKDLFDIQVIAWLDKIGFKQVPDPESPGDDIYLDENNKLLTNADLQAKMADNISGYTSFLQEKLNYKNIQALKLQENAPNENENENENRPRL